MLIQCYSSFSDLRAIGEGDREWLMIFFAILISAGGEIGASVIKWGVISLGATIRHLLPMPLHFHFTIHSSILFLPQYSHATCAKFNCCWSREFNEYIAVAARRQRFSLQLLQRSNSRMVPAPSHFGQRTSFHY